MRSPYFSPIRNTITKSIDQASNARRDRSVFLYMEPKQVNILEPATVGFYRGETRCENCVSFDSGVCNFFVELNSKAPDLFSLPVKVLKHACCNGFAPR